ncbi:hypothetical protein CUU54_20395 [Pectobacterium polaris]|uniref:hypothetical protein n=1 Tax=Pectobacterium polaris TaxID=2042057 RepID=UPI000D618D11|nr:hypothetical protein [Pectobacterium polaris]MCU1791196.1 hypothetical protein [Pectobacterium polaris]PWD55261.1 hypothetical protein DF209_20495 [Pectobacterium polaris]
MDMMSLFVGIIGSIIAAVVIALINKWVWPHFSDTCLYKGVSVEGAWDVIEERNGGSAAVGRLELKQQGCRLRGTSTRTKTRDGKESDRKFNYHGSISGNQITLIFEDARGIGFDTGTYVFTVYNDGKTMVGMSTFHGKAENKIISEPRTLKKTTG